MTGLSKGSKRVCQECQTRFFDLRRSPIMCPKCGTEVVLPMSFKSKAAAKRALVKAKEESLTEVEIVADDAAGDLIEDASELDDGSDVVKPTNNGDSDSDDEAV